MVLQASHCGTPAPLSTLLLVTGMQGLTHLSPVSLVPVLSTSRTRGA